MAVGIALLALVGFEMIIHAAEQLSPPYVIALRPWTSSPEQVKPFAVAVDENQGYAYIAANKGVAILTGTALLDTKEGVGSTIAVASDPRSGYAYVAGKGPEGNIFFLKGTTLLTKQVSLGSNVREIVPFAQTGYVYVALPEADTVSILSGTAFITDVAVGARPLSIAPNPFDGRVYVANSGDNTVSVIETHTEIIKIPVGITPTEVTANPVNGYVYVSNIGDDTVSVIRSFTDVASIPDIQSPGQIAVNAATGRVYVLSADTVNQEGWVKVLDGVTVAKTIPLPLDPRDIDVNPKTNYVYVNIGSGNDSRVTVMSDTLVVETFQMRQTALDIAINKQEDLAYVPIYGGHVAIFGRTQVYGTDPLGPGSLTATLRCTNTLEEDLLPIVIQIPEGAIQDANTRVLCIPLAPVETGADYMWAQQGFRLVVSVDGVNQPSYAFNKPLDVDIAYLADERMPQEIVEEEIELRSRTWLGGGWGWYTAGIQDVTQLRQTNQFLATLTSPGEYALVWRIPHVYLPIIARDM
jgi:YVTN family beta-propeller protein